MFRFNFENTYWINEPKIKTLSNDKVFIKTEPETDLWQRTHYGFRNDNAPALLISTEESSFSFTVKTEFNTKKLYDQCGVIIYQDCDNWFKASIEYKNENTSMLGSVVTNNGYSDWAFSEFSSSQKTVYYRLSRSEMDFLIEYSIDGINFKQMRVFHLFSAGGAINFGIYACSPQNSSFDAIYTEFEVTKCLWQGAE